MVVRVVREEARSSPGVRYCVQVSGPGHTATIGTFDGADAHRAERLARACAIRVATSMRCRISPPSL